MWERLSPTHRQLLLYVTFGVTQLAIDWIGFMLLVHLATPVAIANPSSRTFAAAVGYLLNGSLTFRGADGKRHVNVRSFIRYILLFAILTLMSTVLVSMGGRSLGEKWLPAVKLFVEGGLAVVSFITLKLWVYRRRHL